MPAPGHQDHTPSPSAPGALVSRTPGVHRIPPHVRDDRERPSEDERDGEGYKLICVFGKSEYFCERGLTGKIDLPVEAG
jgi:hypothetical protein